MISIISLAYFILVNSKTTYIFSGLIKEAILGVWQRYILSALNAIEVCCQFPKANIVECAWVPSSTEQNQTPAMGARTP